MSTLKLKLKSKFRFIDKRIDKVSIFLFITLIGIYFSASITASAFFLLITLVVVLLYLRFKILIYLIFSIFLITAYICNLYFTLPKSNGFIQGEVEFIGSNKVINTNWFLWFNKKILLDTDYFIQTGTEVECANAKFERVKDSLVESSGIYFKAVCAGRIKTIPITNSQFGLINKFFGDRFNIFDKDLSELIKGITLGTRPSESLNSTFQSIGLSHIIVISGFNISLLISIITLLLSKIKFINKYFITALFIIIFVFIVGATPPVLRAAFMGTIAFIASSRFKNISTLRVLLLSCIIMVILDPYSIYSISFHLSALATLGIILFLKYLDQAFIFITEILREPFTQSIAAGVFTIPYCINVFSTYSPASILGNILVVPTLSILSIISYLYMLIPLDILRFPITVIGNFILETSLYLAQYTNSLTVLGLSSKNVINYLFVGICIVIAIIYIYNKLRLQDRIEKRLKIE